MSAPERLSFGEAIRRLVADAMWNFKDFRGAVRPDSESVIAEYDGTFAVEGACDAYVHVLDYSVPVARIRFYEGNDVVAADLVFDYYCERLSRFGTAPGEPAELVQNSGGEHRWRSLRFETDTLPVSVYRYSYEPGVEPAAESLWITVYVEIDGFAVECIDGSPDDSIWRIIMGDT
ncbi:MAG TPA: hypothetical protein VFB22_12475 [Candidatus Baltobacteraceae bacterium]|nr:hypothetical protein [Candidatus Baltobacteraceae bacterium]